MPKSSISKLDPRIREAVDTAVREGRATIDEIVSLIGSMGGEASRSAVGRYVKSTAEAMKRYKETMDIADRVVGEMGSNPKGDIGRLGAEILRMATFHVASRMNDDEQPVKPMDIMLLSKALDHLASQDVKGLQRFLKAKPLLDAKLKQLEGKAQAGGKITLEDLKAVRRIYGIADDEAK